jgi:hypothetical protein
MQNSSSDEKERAFNDEREDLSSSGDEKDEERPPEKREPALGNPSDSFS